MFPVISTGSPVSRVAASTRAQRLTASPITLKESRPAPPIEPATTVPELTPTPTSNPPGLRLLIVRASSTAHWTARSAWSGILGRAEDREDRVAEELVDVAAVPGDDRDDALEELVEAGDDLGAPTRRPRR